MISSHHTSKLGAIIPRENRERGGERGRGEGEGDEEKRREEKRREEKRRIVMCDESTIRSDYHHIDIVTTLRILNQKSS